MSRAQEIRQKRLREREREKRAFLIEHAEPVVNWILDLFESSESADEVCLYRTTDNTILISIFTISTSNPANRIETTDPMNTDKKFDPEMMQYVAGMFNQEEGYEAVFNPGSKHMIANLIVRIK